MRLTRYYLRYYPPCLCLEYKKTAGGIDIKEIPLLTLSGSTNLDALAASIVAGEPLLSSRRQPQVRKLLQVLLARQMRGSGREMHMRHVHTLRPHALPLTNFSLSKCGRWLATGSYDKTCKITTFDGDRLCTGAGSAGARTLSGHSNVVFAVAFNAPFDSVVATGGFDKEARLWDARDGALMSTLSGHAGELICVGFSPDGRTLATGAMDGSARLWDVEHGAALHALQHEGEISCLAFDETGGRAATGSFDRRAAVWDVGNGACARKLEGHTGEIAAVQFNFEGSLLLSGATDGTVKLWDVGSGRPVHTLGARGSGGEVTDAVFNETGTQVAVARTGGMAEIFDCLTGVRLAALGGHTDSVTQVRFNPQGTRAVTASGDCTVRVWDLAGRQGRDNGAECLQVLEGHTDEVFACRFNYAGDRIFTASKDNSCRVWRTEDRRETETADGRQ